MSEDQSRSSQQKFDPLSPSSENPTKLQLQLLVPAETPPPDDQEQHKGSISPAESHDHKAQLEDVCKFQTPTSSEHRIPTVESCPAAPSKSRPKRKLDDRQLPEFVEEARREEVESFFRVNEGFVSEGGSRVRSRSAKRRCRSI